MKKLLILVLSLLMAASMVACGSDVKEETFEASASGFGGEVAVKVTFKGEDITKVEVSGPNETSGIGSNAVEQLPAKIEEADSADVDVISGATITSEAIKSAVRKAIKLKNGETDSGISFTAGTYTATVTGYRGEITGEVTFDETSIVSVTVTNCGDTLGIAYGTSTTPVEALTAKIVETQSLGVDTVVGATVSSNAIIAMVADAAAQAGADVDALKAVPVAKEEAKDVTYDVDIVVVGAGAAGLTAGISALEEGASVLIVEKQGVTGGSTARSGGKVLAAGTDLMTEYNMDNNPDLLYDYLMEVGQDFINEDLLKPFVYGSADNLDYLSQHGVVFEDVEAVHSNLPIWWVHNTLGLSGMTDGHGGRITVPLTNSFESLGGEIIYNTAANELITNADGKVVGVKAVKADGSAVTVNAKAVILATGGYAQNREMMARIPGDTGYYSSVPTSNTGDGLVMAGAVGAQIWDSPSAAPVFIDFTCGAGGGEQGGLMVSYEGKRVVNEYSYQFNTALAMEKTGVPYGWYIATSTDPNPAIQYGMTLENTVQSDTLEGLAELCGFDAATFVATVDRYNELCDKGVDEDFGKRADHLWKIEGETYYAFRMIPVVSFTLGGLVLDTEAHVLDANNNPIAGLFAAGEVAFTGLIGDNYPSCGMAIGAGTFYGRIAGATAVAENN